MGYNTLVFRSPLYYTWSEGLPIALYHYYPRQRRANACTDFTRSLFILMKRLCLTAFFHSPPGKHAVDKGEAHPCQPSAAASDL